MLEWYEYFPVSYTTVVMANVRQTLPHVVQRELIQVPETFRESVAVEAEKTAVIAELDRLLRVDSATDFLKHKFVEIRENEIPRFSYFRVVPMILDNLKFKLDIPQCDKCFWGIKLRPPIGLPERVRCACDLGEVVRPHRLDVELIVSERMKAIFDGEGISGLTYQPIDDSAFYLANITASAWDRGDAIVRDTNFCEKHLVGITPVVVRRRTPVDEFQSDFVMIRGVEVGGTRYFISSPMWYVSRRVLEILLKEVRGLRRATIRLKEKFRPCLVG